METLKLTLRVELGGGRALGPGKIRLLEAIDKTGSISQAGRSLGMSYRRAWLLVDDMSNSFRDPVIDARQGGAYGGGTTLAPLATNHALKSPSRRAGDQSDEKNVIVRGALKQESGIGKFRWLTNGSGRMLRQRLSRIR
jgi:molybdate transport repressor ModE-like protein